MALLPNINFTAPRDVPPPDVQARDAMHAAGFDLSREPEMDGRIHRFKTPDDKGREKSGWYIFYGDSRVPAGAFGSWRGDIKHQWRADMGRQISPAEQQAINDLMEAQRLAHEAEAEKRAAQARNECAAIWQAARPASEHPYLTKKQVDGAGLRVTGDGRLVIPIYQSLNDDPQRPSSLQYIEPDGHKQFHLGGAVSGGFLVLPPTSGRSDRLYLAEGYATAASVHAATGEAVVMALNAGNLSKVGVKLREALPAVPFVFVADNDKSGVGKAKATDAAAACGNATVVMPPDIGTDANDYAVSGGDLRALLLGLPPKWLLSFDEMCKEGVRVEWLIKNWIQKSAQMMLFGPSGTYKSFTALDIAYAVGCPSVQSWHGNRVLNHGRVVYLQGEGTVGQRARAAGLRQYMGGMWANIDFSDGATNFNTPEGVRFIIDEIKRRSPEPPVLIIVDTLNRFLAGDENKADDAKTMLDAMAEVSAEFDHAAVLVVHHTGINPEAQNRARGSSAWRGAADVEIMTAVNRETGQMTLAQTKNKDAELPAPLTFELKKIEISGRVDEDGQPITTLVLQDADPEADTGPAETLTKAQNFALNTYLHAAQEFGELDDEGRFTGLKLEDWRKVFYRESTAESENTKRGTFNRARKDLAESCKIKVENDVYFLNQEKNGLLIKIIENSIKTR